MDRQTIENHFHGDYHPFYSRYLPGISNTGDEIKALCPFHEDHNPSLTVNRVSGLFKCFGCDTSGSSFDFYARQHNMILPADFSKVLAGIALDFHIGNGDKQTVKPKVVKRYDYLNEAGKLVYQIERLEPKSFRIRRPDGQGWAYNAKGIEIILYHLPEVLKADEVLVVEGEKDADALAALGFTATSNPFGAGKWPESFGRFFAGKTVVLIPDNDDPGRQHMRAVAKNIKGHAASIKWLDLPDLPEKGDVSDFINSFKDQTEVIERLSILIDGAPTYEDEHSEEAPSKFHFLSAGDLIARPTPAAWIIKPYVDQGTLVMIFGEPGSMKSFLSIDMGLCIASGHTWHEHPIQKRGPVFYIAGEGFAGIACRLKAWATFYETDLNGIPFFVSDRPAQFLDTEAVKDVVQAVDLLRAAHGEPGLITIDTLNRNFGPGDENSTEDMTKFISAVDIALRTKYHCTIQIIHHSGLSQTERARGNSALRAALDWEYRLQKNSDGARIFSCTKSKDHQEPPTICFKPEVVRLDGWVEPDDGEVMTSCVLRQVDGVHADKRPLSGAKRIVLEALRTLGNEYVRIDIWRDAAYLAGISPTSSPDAKRMAFKRAVSDLLEAGLVKAQGDYWKITDKGERT